LERIGDDTLVDYNVSRLRGRLMLYLLVFGMLDGNELSTRLLAEHYNSELFKAVSGKGDHRTRHSSIADRLRTIESDYFAQVFDWLYQKFSGQFSTTKLGKQVKRFDSTMVGISSALVDYGMRVGSAPHNGKPRTHQIKFTLELHGALPKSMRLFTQQAELSEQTALRQAILEAGIKPEDYVVFDAGLSDRLTFSAFDHLDIHFVSRLKQNNRARSLATYRHIQGRRADGLRFERDERVELYASGQEVIGHEFRLIEAVDEASGRVLSFVTNLWELSAMDIARIYRARWDIEVFFRYLKQNLNFSRLINRSENGIRVQMYAALITSILLIVYRAKNGIKSHKIARIRFFYELLADFAAIAANPPRKKGARKPSRGSPSSTSP
jgi:hypothetical protein